jgi:hypothetical protein
MAAPLPRLAEPRVSPDNPFSAGEVVRDTRPGGLVAVEQQRAIAEVQAQYLVAKSHPRDPITAMERIMNACTRPTLARAAIYEYARGGNDIRGPSIRLVEAVAQVWGNIMSGVSEVARHGDYSECVAFATDLESGYTDRRQFQIRHWRDTKQGGYQLRDERDIYELIANFGARRKRAALMTIIPGDVIEAAVDACERTMTAKADTSAEGIRRMLEAFAEFGVTQPQIEARIQRRVDAIRPAQVVQLQKIYASLRDGMSDAADWFEAVPAPVEPTNEAAKSDAPPPADAPQTRRGRGRPRAAPAENNAPQPPPSPPADDQRREPPPQTGNLPTFEV